MTIWKAQTKTPFTDACTIIYFLLSRPCFKLVKCFPVLIYTDLYVCLHTCRQVGRQKEIQINRQIDRFRYTVGLFITLMESWCTFFSCHEFITEKSLGIIFISIHMDLFFFLLTTASHAPAFILSFPHQWALGCIQLFCCYK